MSSSLTRARTGARVVPVETTPTAPARLERPDLLELLEGVPDFRARRGVRHVLAVLLAVALAAVLTGARSFVAIGEWATDTDPGVLERLGVKTARIPCEATLRRAVTGADAAMLARVVGAFLFTRTATVAGRRVIAVDGKTVRGARAGAAAAPHLVAAYDHDTGVVLGQLAVAAKSNEIPTVRDLLACFDLSGVVVTADAMHTQTGTADLIIAGGGHYVLQVKANQKRLYQACKGLPWGDIPQVSSVATGHGRRTRRTIKAVATPGWVHFPHAAQVAQIRRTTTVKGRKRVEVVYVISSLPMDQAPPSVLACWVQGHWGIETALHWVRDVTYDEDRSQVRTGTAPETMATLRNIAISLLRLAGHANIAAALRHHARHPDHAVDLILNPPERL